MQHVPTTIIGAAAGRRAPLHPILLALALVLGAVGAGIGGAAPADAATPHFELPFRCGETWYGGTRPDHAPAIDFNSPHPDHIETGMPVLASAAGRVTVAHRADDWGGGYGYWVEIDHGGGWRTRYAHMYAPPVVHVGQDVAAGTHLGGVGNTGHSYGAHLHYEQRLHGAKATVTFGGQQYTPGLQGGGGIGAPITSRNCGPVRVANPCGSFWDTSVTNSFCDEILWASGSGITEGYPDGTFRPTDAVSRQALAAFLYRFQRATPSMPPTYRDVAASHRFADEIGWMQAAGIAQGYPDGTYRPTSPITRQAMASFLWKLAGSPAAPPSRFGDVPTNHTFRGAIDWLAASGVSTGYQDGTFRPGEPLSRQAMVAFLQRYAGA